MNLEIWNNLKQPPPAALKTIGAGRLKGKSDINPQWRYQMLTEQFGVCGIGWKFTIDKLWTEPGTAGVMFCFALVSLHVKIDGAWTDPIPGTGGHKLIEMESAGLHDNDEGFKMAVTDALGTAAKMIGVAADIYLGNWDGSKYREDANGKPPPRPKPAAPVEEMSAPLGEIEKARIRGTEEQKLPALIAAAFGKPMALARRLDVIATLTEAKEITSEQLLDLARRIRASVIDADNQIKLLDPIDVRLRR